MPRKRKQDVKVNDSESLEGLMQETYNDACLQINEAQKTINELTATITPIDIDDVTKVVKEKGGLLKIKDSAIRIKLEIAKLQSDIIKSRGDVDSTTTNRSEESDLTKNFKTIREMIKNNAFESNNETDSETE